MAEKEKVLKTTDDVLHHWPILQERIKEVIAEIGKEQFEAMVEYCDLLGVEMGMYLNVIGGHKTYLIFSSKFMKRHLEDYKRHLEK